MVPALIPGAEGYDVLPPGRHTITLSEVLDNFILGRPDELVRRALWQDFEDFRAGQLAHGIRPIAYWIDGSFSSGKEGPSDIDFTTIVDGPGSQPTGPFQTFLNVGPAWQANAHPVLGRTLKLDAYAVVKVADGAADQAIYQQTRGYWDDWWQRERSTGEVEAKGYLEVRP